jgi:hypothetical protein
MVVAVTIGCGVALVVLEVVKWLGPLRANSPNGSGTGVGDCGYGRSPLLWYLQEILRWRRETMKAITDGEKFQFLDIKYLGRKYPGTAMERWESRW